MKIALALLSLFASATLSLANDIQPGQWLLLFTHNGNVEAGGNFTVSKNGEMRGKALYADLAGEHGTLTGSANSKGIYRLRIKSPGSSFNLDGKLDKDGKGFTSALGGGDRVIGIRTNDTHTGVYSGKISPESSRAAVIIEKSGRATFLFVEENKKVSRLTGTADRTSATFKRGEFSLKLTVGSHFVRGDAKSDGKKLFTLNAEKL